MNWFGRRLKLYYLEWSDLAQQLCPAPLHLAANAMSLPLSHCTGTVGGSDSLPLIHISVSFSSISFITVSWWQKMHATMTKLAARPFQQYKAKNIQTSSHPFSSKII
jgi:hypothetical protein